jgi:aryl carrier-like protein
LESTPDLAGVAQVMADVLAVDEVGLLDNFHGLGGDSLRSIQVLEHLRVLGITLTARQFLAYPTVTGLAKFVDEVPAEKPLAVTSGPGGHQ